MAKMNLQARIDRLKAAPAMCDMPAYFDKTYDYIWLMELATLPLKPGETLEDRTVTFEEKHGTRGAFIAARMERWHPRI
jgi:hypothetical protein